MSARGRTADGPVELGPWLTDSRAWADRVLESALEEIGNSPPRLVEVVRYALLGAGKRLRPAVVRMMCAHFGGDDAAAGIPAAAVECVHAYSLVHDDLPCMDDDDLRRGRPTCHKVYGEARAILAGDALLTLAFGLLARAPARPAELARVLADGAGHGGMVGGQVLDLDADADSADRALVVEIHARKTAALFSAAAEMGAIAAGADPAGCRAAAAYGSALGRCFQATDDILDVTGSATTLGKTPGKDARGRKPTLVAALGVGPAHAEALRLADLARAAARALPGGRTNRPEELVASVLSRPK
ncbi:MAG: polyprenyl synthetase family protein [Planctomycetota bacterium]